MANYPPGILAGLSNSYSDPYSAREQYERAMRDQQYAMERQLRGAVAGGRVEQSPVFDAPAPPKDNPVLLLLGED